jgi:acyl-CoA synthetase (AMP-forming)/AMP-acid ligase II
LSSPKDLFIDPQCHLFPVVYRKAFGKTGAPFLFFYENPSEAESQPCGYTRSDFLVLALKALEVLQRLGITRGERFLNGFGANSPLDLAFRLAAVLVGATPVTLNWQADTPVRAAFKASLSKANLILTDALVDDSIIEAVKSVRPGITTYDTRKLPKEPFPVKLPEPEEPKDEAEKIVIFTSGTTGDPKGVILTWKGYDVNTEALRHLFSKKRRDPMELVMINPLHHTNSSALSEWFLREPGTVIHMLPRYTTAYWRILAETAEQSQGLVIAPCVSRHFDFLEELDTRDELPIEKERLKRALSKVSFLMGSAPVGPTTVERVLRWTGHIPSVRFGSTETCLQVLGSPPELSEDQLESAFQAGWQRTPAPGYYIGRPHPPFTEATVVKGILPEEDGFMERCAEGEEGYLVARGGNLMKGYLDDPRSTAAVLHEGWYLGFGDIGFRLRNAHDEGDDFYWVGRESALLIKGGANYSCEQIASELSDFVRSRYSLEAESFDLAITGLSIKSEHEDSCCVTLDISRLPADARKEIERTFITEASKHVSKNSRPDKLRLGPIPRNFKGALEIKELKRAWLEELADDGSAVSRP